MVCRAIVVLLLGSGCRSILGFEAPSVAGADASIGGDGPADGALDAPACIVDGIVPPEGLSNLELATQVIDTDSDAACLFVPVVAGVDTCAIGGVAVTIPSGVLVAATGSRPLLVFACDDLVIAGTLDASSQQGRAGPAAGASCSNGSPGESDRGGGGGGAGGSFGDSGAAGGVGDTNNSIGGDGTALAGTPGATVTISTAPIGGCAGSSGGRESLGGGQGGTGGAGGGAVWLASATSITIEGGAVVAAGGAAGNGGAVQAGGGGGGSGGWIRVAAPTVVIDGVVAANGGGGGGGGARINNMPFPGSRGEDARYDAIPAAGGAGGTSAGLGAGAGGVGAAGSSTAGIGESSEVGAGGGGGGAGAIRLVGTAMVNGIVSPPAP